MDIFDFEFYFPIWYWIICLSMFLICVFVNHVVRFSNLLFLMWMFKLPLFSMEIIGISSYCLPFLFYGKLLGWMVHGVQWLCYILTYARLVNVSYWLLTTGTDAFSSTRVILICPIMRMVVFIIIFHSFGRLFTLWISGAIFIDNGALHQWV